MAYSELIKNYENIRDYVRDFFAYGFHTRNDFDLRSARSYDNEKRRVESWLSDYMRFYQNENGKYVYISVDSRNVAYNPLYKVFKTKSFTAKDIELHFFILDILADEQEMTAREIYDIAVEDYYDYFGADIFPDLSTVRNKLNEYVALGILRAAKKGKELYYQRTDSNIKEDSLIDAIAFASEVNPLGVIGSFLMDKYDFAPEHFSYKHHYLLSALDQNVLAKILVAISGKQKADIVFKAKNEEDALKAVIFPIKVYVSTQNGKQYLMAYWYSDGKIKISRLDRIQDIKSLAYEENHEEYQAAGEEYGRHLWGISTRGDGPTGGDGPNATHMCTLAQNGALSRELCKLNRESACELDHVEMLIYANANESYIVERLNREKRCGSVEKVDDCLYLFKADVYDALEMLPWVRTFIGRIEKFSCSRTDVERLFYEDLDNMKAIYGGDDSDFQ